MLVHVVTLHTVRDKSADAFVCSMRLGSNTGSERHARSTPGRARFRRLQSASAPFVTGLTGDDFKGAKPCRKVINLRAQWPRKATSSFWGEDEAILSRACQKQRMPFRWLIDSGPSRPPSASAAQPALRASSQPVSRAGKRGCLAGKVRAPAVMREFRNFLF